MKKKTLFGLLAAGAAVAAVMYCKKKQKKETDLETDDNTENTVLKQDKEENPIIEGIKTVSEEIKESIKKNPFSDAENISKEAEPVSDSENLEINPEEPEQETAETEADVKKEIPKNNDEFGEEVKTVSPIMYKIENIFNEDTETKEGNGNTENLVSDDILNNLTEQISNAAPIFSEKKALTPDEIKDTIDDVDVSDILKENTIKRAGIKKRNSL